MFWQLLLCFGSHYCVLGANIRERLPCGVHCLTATLPWPYNGFAMHQFVICTEGCCGACQKKLVDANYNQESALSVKIVRGSFGQPAHVRGYGFIYFLQHTITANHTAMGGGGGGGGGGGVLDQTSIIASHPK